MEGLFYYCDFPYPLLTVYCLLFTAHRLLFTVTCTSIGRFANRPYNRTQQPSYQYREPLLTLRSSFFAFHFSRLFSLVKNLFLKKD